MKEYLITEFIKFLKNRQKKFSRTNNGLIIQPSKTKHQKVIQESLNEEVIDFINFLNSKKKKSSFLKKSFRKREEIKNQMNKEDFQDFYAQHKFNSSDLKFNREEMNERKEKGHYASLDWAGGLEDINPKISSLELQKEITDSRGL